MLNLFDIILLKQRALDGDDKNTKTVFWMMFEKVSVILCLVIVLAVGLALSLPWWAIGALVGLSIGPIVYAHLYFIYVRPVKKRQEHS